MTTIGQWIMALTCGFSHVGQGACASATGCANVLPVSSTARRTGARRLALEPSELQSVQVDRATPPGVAFLSSQATQRAVTT